MPRPATFTSQPCSSRAHSGYHCTGGSPRSLETAGYVAWLCYDLGERHSAARYYAMADVATREAGDPALVAYVRGFQSLVMDSQGQACKALVLAQGAVEMAERSATATMRAWLAGLEARALAAVGDRKACLITLRRADIAVGQARREEDRPGCTSSTKPACWLSQAPATGS